MRFLAAAVNPTPLWVQACVHHLPAALGTASEREGRATPMTVSPAALRAIRRAPPGPGGWHRAHLPQKRHPRPALLAFVSDSHPGPWDSEPGRTGRKGKPPESAPAVPSPGGARLPAEPPTRAPGSPNPRRPISEPRPPGRALRWRPPGARGRCRAGGPGAPQVRCARGARMLCGPGRPHALWSRASSDRAPRPRGVNSAPRHLDP